MRRRNAGTARATYLKWLQDLEALYGGDRFGHSWAAEITAVQAGEPIIVEHGYEIDLPPNTGPFCLEPDGTITPVEPVYRDPDAPLRTVIGHRRPDRTMVQREPPHDRATHPVRANQKPHLP